MKQVRVDPLLKRPFQAVLVTGPHQAAHEALQVQEEHGVPSFHRLHPQGDGQMGLTHTGRAEKDDTRGPFDEAQARQLPDHLAVDGRLEVELFQGLDPWEAR